MKSSILTMIFAAALATSAPTASASTGTQRSMSAQHLTDALSRSSAVIQQRQGQTQNRRLDQTQFVTDSYAECALASLDHLPTPDGVADCQEDGTGAGFVCAFSFSLDQVAEHKQQCEASGGAAHVEFDDLSLFCTLDQFGSRVNLEVTYTNEIVCVSPDPLCDPHRGDDFCLQWDDLQAFVTQLVFEEDEDISNVECAPLPGSSQCTVTEFDFTAPTMPPVSTPTPAPVVIPPPNQPTPIPSTVSENSGLSTGVIAGIAAGGAVLIIVIIVASYFCCCRKKKNNNDDEADKSMFVANANITPVFVNSKPNAHVAHIQSDAERGGGLQYNNKDMGDDDDEDESSTVSEFDTVLPPPPGEQSMMSADPMTVQAFPVSSVAMPVVKRVSGGAIMVETTNRDANGDTVTQRVIFPNEAAARSAGYQIM